MIDLGSFKSEKEKDLYLSVLDEYWDCLDERVKAFFDPDSDKNLKYKLAYLKAVNEGTPAQMIKGWEKALEKYPGINGNPDANWDL